LARRSNSPWSKTYKEGLPTTAVDDHVNINQTVAGTITTGVIDSATGLWKGITVSDDAFNVDATHEAVPNTGEVLSPQSTPQYIDMTDFNDLYIALLPTRTGNYAITAVMGPNDNYLANLFPVNPASTLRGCTDQSYPAGASSFDVLFDETSEPLTADVWNIFLINGRLSNQKLMQFKITNNSGGESNIQFAYLRMV